MKTNLIIILSVFLLTSCAATQIKSAASRSRYAPANYQTIGSIQYDLNGADFAVEMRREDAFKTMFDECQGSYEIVREGRKSEFMAVSNKQLGMQYIEYRCVQKAAAN